MTKKEAYLFLKIAETDNFDEIEQAFEDQLFEIKSYLNSKLPVKKLFDKKLTQLRLLFEAYKLITGIIFEKQKSQKLDYQFNDSILETFNLYHSLKNKIKALLLNSTNHYEIEALCDELIYLEKKYAKCWLLDNLDTKIVIISKLPDDILIYKSIIEFQSNNCFLFEDLKNFKNNPPKPLIDEMKRLSLFFQMYG
jgi:hypothetical protein